MLEPGFYNMDCMKAMKEFPDGFFDLAIVDPVYGDVTKGGYMTQNPEYWARMKSYRKEMYHQSLWNQEKTGQAYFQELRRVSKNQIIWGWNNFTEYLPNTQSYIVWDKNRAKGVSFADCELAYTSFSTSAKVFRFTWDGWNQEIHEDRIHPTQKPVRLYEWILKNYAKPGDKILDTHVGSTSSLIACYRGGYKYWGFEIDEVYFRDAQKRLEREKAQISIFDQEGVT